MVMSEKAQTFQSFLAQVKDAATVLEEQETSSNRSY
jgi:hypothetical protein